MPVIEAIIERLAQGKTLEQTQAFALAAQAADDPQDLFDTAARATQLFASHVFNICGVVSAKTGACSCDCKWCPQSSHWPVKGIPINPILPTQEIEDIAQRAMDAGIRKFALVASGRKPSPRETRLYADRCRSLRAAYPDLEICGSLGLLNDKDIAELKEAGLVRVHCNLETSRRFFPQCCTTHTWDDKVKTIRSAQKAGLDVCSGALLGIGETLADRIDLAYVLRELRIPSIPLNVLNPKEGTPLGHAPKFPEKDFLITVALYRLINPSALLRFAGGRLQLSDDTVRKAMHIGVNAAICGHFPTTCGAGPVGEARRFVAAGYESDSAAQRALTRAAQWENQGKNIADARL